MEATLLGIYYDERAAPHFGQNLNFFSLLKPQLGQNRNILDDSSSIDSSSSSCFTDCSSVCSKSSPLIFLYSNLMMNQLSKSIWDL